MKNKKSLGQHWLKNRAILEEIADLAAGATPVMNAAAGGENADLAALTGANLLPEATRAPLSPVCLEIGPGLGTLTSSLLKRFRKVVAVEFDAELARKLPGSFPGKNLEVVNEDVLKFDFGKFKDFVVVGNIPYYITSPIIEKLLRLEPAPRRIVLLIQKEVAERIAGERESLLSLEVKNRAEVALGLVVRREEFTPPPKVDSQVIVLTPHAPEVGEEVFGLIRQGFKAPRKKLKHNLAGIVPEKAFLAAKIDENARPGDLRLADWARLYNSSKTA